MKFNKSLFIEIIIILLSSTVIGIVSSFFLNGLSSYIAGFTTLIVISLFFVQKRVNEIELKNRKIYETINSLIKEGSFRDIFVKQFLYNFDNINEKGISSDKDDYSVLWLNSIVASRKSWIVTNYAKTRNVWERSYAEKIVNIQFAQSQNGQKIFRLFIFETDDEMKAELPILQNQVKQGAKINWILKKSIPNVPDIKRIIKQIGTIDFAIVDDDWIFRAYLDRNRNVKYVNVIRNSNLTKKAKLLMDELVKNSQRIE